MEPWLQVTLAVITMLNVALTVIGGGWLAIIKLRESNNVKELLQRVAFLESENQRLLHEKSSLEVSVGLLRRDVTSLRRALEKYTQAGQESLIVVDESGLVVDWDAAAALMFGYSSEEAIGKDVSGLIVPPENRQKHRYGMMNTFRNQRQPRTEPLKTRAMTKSGEVIDVEVQLLPGWETGGNERGWRYGARIRRLILPSPEAKSDDNLPTRKP